MPTYGIAPRYISILRSTRYVDHILSHRRNQIGWLPMSAKAAGRVWDLDLPHNKQHVLLAMADHADHEGRNMFPSLDLIAWKTGYSYRQVRRIVEELVHDRILVMRKPARQQYPATYDMDLSAGTAKPAFDRHARKTNGQNVHPENGQNVHPEKSRVDISAHPGWTFETSRVDIAMSTKPTEPVVNHVVVGDRARADLFRALRKRTIGRDKATAICATDASAADILTSIDNLFDPKKPETMGGVINLLIDAPPAEGHPYERLPRSDHAPDQRDRHARNEKRPRGSHNGTGGAELRDPGWMDREIAAAEARARQEL